MGKTEATEMICKEVMRCVEGEINILRKEIKNLKQEIVNSDTSGLPELNTKATLGSKRKELSEKLIEWTTQRSEMSRLISERRDPEIIRVGDTERLANEEAGLCPECAYLWSPKTTAIPPRYLTVDGIRSRKHCPLCRLFAHVIPCSAEIVVIEGDRRFGWLRIYDTRPNKGVYNLGIVDWLLKAVKGYQKPETGTRRGSFQRRSCDTIIRL